MGGKKVVENLGKERTVGDEWEGFFGGRWWLVACCCFV